MTILMFSPVSHREITPHFLAKERRRRGDERGEERRRRGVEEMLEMEGEEEVRAGDHLEFRPRRLRHPWTEEVS